MAHGSRLTAIMPLPTQGLTLKNLTQSIRQDLSDTDSTNYRWSDAVIAREVDRAVDRYSQVAPNLSISQIPTIPYSRLYAIPTNAWWIERIEYPVGRWPKQYQKWFERISPKIFDPLYSNPYFTGVPQFGVTAAAGGQLSSGVYKYAFTWIVPGGGETLPSAVVTVTSPASGIATLASIPNGPYGVVDCTIYRTQVNGSTLSFLTNLGSSYRSPASSSSAAGTNNQVSLVTITDAAADGALNTAIQPPGANSTEGVALFEIQLDQSRLPVDNTGIVEVTTAYKHELDQLGTTIPEKYWDVIALGAEAFLVQAYVANVNDNFDYVDGQFRDRVDDTKSAVAWSNYGRLLMDRFEARLQAVRNAIEATTPNYPQWGDKPIRWDRI